MQMHVIITKTANPALDAALARVETLMEAVRTEEEDDELDVLATLIELYEDARFPMDAPDPIAAIKFRMEQMGKSSANSETVSAAAGTVATVKIGETEIAAYSGAANAAEGVWGYSTPNQKHVLFCADTGKDKQMQKRIAVLHEFGIIKHGLINMGTGVWMNGPEEVTYVLTEGDWAQAKPRLRSLIRLQETVLVLGHLKSRNWRDAWLIGMKQEFEQHIGTWHEVYSTAEALAVSDGWTKIGGHTYAIQRNPPASPADDAERKLTDALLSSATLSAWLMTHIDSQQGMSADAVQRLRRNFVAIQPKVSDLLEGRKLSTGEVITRKRILPLLIAGMKDLDRK